MFRGIRHSRIDNLPILHHPAHIYDRGSIRRRRRILHHDGRVILRLEIRKRPFRRRVMRFHPLQGVDEEPSAGEIDGAVFFGDDAALNAAAGPKGVAHGAPGLLWVGSEEGFAVTSDLEAWGGAGDGEVDDAGFVDGGFDGVGCGGIVESDGAAVGVEGEFTVVETLVVESVGAPEGVAGGLSVFVWVEDFGVELAGCMDTTG